MYQEYEEKADHKNYFNKVLVVRDIENIKKQDRANEIRRHQQMQVRKHVELQDQHKFDIVYPWMHSGINKDSSIIL